MIGQNRQASFQQAKADHDFVASELELHTNTELTSWSINSPPRSTHASSQPQTARPRPLATEVTSLTQDLCGQMTLSRMEPHGTRVARRSPQAERPTGTRGVCAELAQTCFVVP